MRSKHPAGAVAGPTLALALVLVSVVPAAAEYGPHLDLEDLVAASVVVVRGTVTSVDAAFEAEAGNIYTYVRLDVDEVLLGEVPTDRIILKQLGGAVGDIAQYVGGQPGFDPGEEVVVFLTVRPRDRTLYTTALWQGKWGLEQGERGSLVRRHAGLDLDGEPVLEQLLDLERLREVTGGARPAAGAGPIRFLPAEAPPALNTVDRPRPLRTPLLGFSWHEAFDGRTVPFHFHRQRQPGVGRGRKQLRAAIAAWNGIPRTGEVFDLGRRRRGRPPGTELRDPRGVQDLLLQNGDPNGELSNTGGTLAIGGAWYFPGIVIHGLAKGTSGFIVMNDGPLADSFLKDRTCYRNVLTHEVGHTAGLGHSTRARSLMFPSVDRSACAGDVISPGKDDQRSFRRIYRRRFVESGRE